MIFADVYITKIGNDILTAAAAGKTITWLNCKCCNQSIDSMEEGAVMQLTNLPGQAVATGSANLCTIEQGEDSKIATISCELSNENSQIPGYANSFGLYAQCEEISGLAVIARVGGNNPTYFPTPDQDGKNILTAFVDISVVISNEAASIVLLNQQAYARNAALLQETQARIAGDQRSVTCYNESGAPYGDNQDIYGRKVFKEALSVNANNNSFMITKPLQTDCTIGVFGQRLSQNATITFSAPNNSSPAIYVNNDIKRDGDHEMITFGTSSMPFMDGYFENFTVTNELDVDTIVAGSVESLSISTTNISCSNTVRCKDAIVTNNLNVTKIESGDIESTGTVFADTVQCAEIRGLIPHIDNTSTLQSPKIPVGAIVMICLMRSQTTTDETIPAGSQVTAGGSIIGSIIGTIRVATITGNSFKTSPTGANLTGYTFRTLCNTIFAASSSETNVLAICIESPT